MQPLPDLKRTVHGRPSPRKDDQQIDIRVPRRLAVGIRPEQDNPPRLELLGDPPGKRSNLSHGDHMVSFLKVVGWWNPPYLP